MNAGTATLKVAVFELRSGELVEVHHADREWPDRTDAFTLVRDALGDIQQTITAIGHRVVHGGDEFTATVQTDSSVEQTLEKLLPLAPLHNSRALESIRAARRALPAVPSFAVFDTSRTPR